MTRQEQYIRWRRFMTEEFPDRLIIGDPVQVLSGASAGVTGTVEGLSLPSEGGLGRVFVRLDGPGDLGGAIEVERDGVLKLKL